MKVDDTIRESLQVVKEKMKEKHGVEIGEMEILDIIESQTKGTSYGLKKGVSVKLQVIGRFLFLDKKKSQVAFNKLFKLREFFSEIDFNNQLLETKIAFIKRNIARWKKERETKMTVIELVRKPNISNGTIIYDRLNKLLKEKDGK